ncbi:hypothetical protein DEJ50_23070 [Streptomyces venezuelae]|uniref:Carboxypeptidase regulatory-like domain-containing protein n=1 Tax=Streptomyces venezuelae TaxID=54571 RepID=A0A5P2D7U4_STRVZ|nr:hypothetical protein [Streptomyces venezuelae]QES50277.1 hypothetical protein DEJ50_23070 [Streptomyces venezuelae]
MGQHTRRAAGIAAMALAVALVLAGCEEPSPDPKPGRSSTSDGGAKPTGKPDPKPSRKSTPPTSPGPEDSPSPEKPSPTPWVPKGPARLAGCGTHASGYQCSFRGSNFEPGEKIRLNRDGGNTGGNVLTADENGEFAIDLVSSTPSGTYTYVAHGQRSNRRATAEVRIIPGLWG